MKEILKKVRKYEIKIRKAINLNLQGSYNSIFKGTGLDFDDLRPYNYGDDVRTINWNISAKQNSIYINTYKEEKEQSIFFLIDVSKSQEIGNKEVNKINISKEICSVLTLSAIRENNQVGLICFSDIKEKYIKPSKGISHGYSIIKNLYNLKTKSNNTDLNKLINFSMNAIKKKSIIILISDFLDKDYMKNLISMSKKHDLILIQIFDCQEIKSSNLGIIPIRENESNTNLWINTSSKDFQKTLDRTFKLNEEKIYNESKKSGINYLKINTNEDYIPSLIKLFRTRNRYN
tara:strand:+ start:286 stop:1155 length:870 start_codon:yes stop_codon:yes gene_type:complete